MNNKNREKIEQQPIAPRVKMMHIGDRIMFPVQRISVVKNTCSTIGLQIGAVYKTHVRRDDNIIEVIRIS